jgi:hypothetical protein
MVRLSREEVLKAMAELDKRMLEKVCHNKALNINAVENWSKVKQGLSACHPKSTGVSLALIFSKTNVKHLLSDLLMAIKQISTSQPRP